MAVLIITASCFIWRSTRKHMQQAQQMLKRSPNQKLQEISVNLSLVWWQQHTRASGRYISKLNCLRRRPGCHCLNTSKWLHACQKQLVPGEIQLSLMVALASGRHWGILLAWQAICKRTSQFSCQCWSQFEYTVSMLYVDSEPHQVYLNHWLLCSPYHFA